MQIVLDAENPSLRELAFTAQQEPVTLQEADRDIAVIVSSEEYTRLITAQWDDFDEFCADLSAQAKANGLTEDGLARLLAEIDTETPR